MEMRNGIVGMMCGCSVDDVRDDVVRGDVGV